MSLLPDASGTDFILKIKKMPGARVERPYSIVLNTITYPETILDSEAFLLLKDWMVTEHTETIHNMNLSLDRLLGMSLED